MQLRTAFIDAMSRAVTGVTVVTTLGADGEMGQTVSAMASVTADPPTLLVCIKSTSVIVGAIHQHGAFGVNVLRSDQRRVADTFAGRSTWGAPYDFSIATWTQEFDDVPLLTGAVGRFTCTIASEVEIGSHTVMFGQVRHADTAAGSPLLYAHRTYGEHVEIPRQVMDLPFDQDVRLVDEDRQGGFRE